MRISEEKKKIVIDNYFKAECDVNTSIKGAFIKGFELGLKKAPVPQLKVKQWIPCSERLPDEDVEVFIYLYRDVPVIAWIDSKGRWYTEDYEVDKDDEPVAWMELPKPYRGDWK